MPRRKPGEEVFTPEQMKEVFDAGVLARQNRVAMDTCAHDAGHPMRLEWERGWKFQLVAECTTPELLRVLGECSMTCVAEAIDQLDENQRQAIVNWLDTYPVPFGTDQDAKEMEEFVARRPDFVQITDGADANNLRVIAVAPISAPPAEGATTSTEPVPEPVKEAPIDPKSPEGLAKEYKRQAKWIRRITRANDTFKDLNALVAERDSEVRAAKGRLASATEERDAAGVELSQLITDHQSGQDYLFDDDDDDAAKPKTPTAVQYITDNWLIDELGADKLKATVGEAEFEAANSREEPIGLTEKMLDKFAGQDIRTISAFEQRMRDDRDWYVFLAAKMDAKVVRRVCDSLLAFRRVHPQGEVVERDKTTLESLADKNAEAMAVPTAPTESVETPVEPVEASDAPVEANAELAAV